MKNYTILTIYIITLCCIWTALPLFAAGKNVPHEIAGIALGSDVKNYPEIIQNNFLKEVVVTDWHGFRKGTISYGACKNINQILKMDLKYENTSKEFFQTLLKKFRDKFGEPGAWEGDSFGVMHVWKWRFIDKDNNRVSLSLQYNGKNSNETIGNVVRLSYPDKIEDERHCFAKLCQNHHRKVDAKRMEELKKSDWSYLIPR